jgi:CrcB protein
VRADVPLLAAVCLGGAVGGGARYGLGAWAGSGGRDLELVAILVVNTVGCGLIGVLTVLAAEAFADVRLLRPALGTGVLGGFTTFSTYAVDVVALAEQGRWAPAVGYLVATPVLAMVAVWGASLLVRAALGARRGPGG